MFSRLLANLEIDQTFSVGNSVNFAQKPQVFAILLVLIQMDTLRRGASKVENNDCGNCNLEQPSHSKDFKKQHNCDAIGVDSVQELGTALHTLHVEEGCFILGRDLPSEDDGSSGVDDENVSARDCDNELDDLKGTSNIWSSFHADEFELANNSSRHSVSLPECGKLVSAMKGSREKEGITPRKLSVSWAPDVYDPPPTSLFCCPKKKTLTRQQIKSNKKHGKGKQKGKNAHGGGSGPKEKKHYRKVGGRSDRCLDAFAESDRVISSKGYKSSAELLDFDYDDDLYTPDSSCGSSYRGKNRGSMRFAYAEV